MSDDRKRVFLGMPGYKSLTGGAALGFFAASKRHDLHLRHHSSSLLAHNFNVLWAWALNGAKGGKPYDYFAMQHADIEPPQGWLDVLIDELEANDLDVLGVPVAIKDGRGLTSTALARPDGDPWRVHCRLTVAEVLKLPETFTSADLGYPLLLNTGLWVCRFTGDWVKRVHFTINDRIAIDTDGDFVAEVEPEDWFFSRLLHEHGLRVGATRKVQADHRGETVFPNSHAWGECEFDREYLTRSVFAPDPITTVGA